MAAPRFMVASLADFLKSGRLGSLRIGTPMKDVATLLGPPKCWSYFLETDAPDFWSYDQLEVEFTERRPRRVRLIQIPRANSLRGKVVRVCDRLRLDQSGFIGRMRPSDILRAGLWPQANMAVAQLLVGDELQLRIGHYPVQVLYVVSDLCQVAMSAAVDAFQRDDWSLLVRFFEDYAELHAITVFSSSYWQERHWSAPMLKVSAARYLALAAPGPA